MDQNQNQLNKQCSPYFASVNFSSEQDTQEDRIELTRKFISLPKSTRYGLFDAKTEEAVQRAVSLFGIKDPNRAGEVSRIIRDIFFDKIGEEAIRKRALEKIGLAEERIGSFIEEVKEIVLIVKKEGREELAASIEKMPIIPALKKYEKLGEQEITDSEIQIEVSDRKEFVDPTIKNWLEDYIQNKGAQAHDNLERSDYLYKAKNTENLSGGERDKLSIVLRSYDLDELVVISKDDQEVVFDTSLQQDKGLKKPDDVRIDSKKQTEKDATQGAPFSKKFDLSSQGVNKTEDANPPEKSLSDAKSGEGTMSENTQKGPKEISWYGTKASFDNLEKIKTDVVEDQSQSSQEQLENRSMLADQKGIRRDFHLKHKPQKTKHVVDLKEMGK